MLRASRFRTGRHLTLALISLMVLTSLVLAACGGAPTAAPAQPTAVPALPTAAPTAVPVQPTAAPAQPTAAPAQPTAPPKPTDTLAPTETPKPTVPPAPTFNGSATISFVQEPDNLNPLYTQMFFSEIAFEFYLKPLWSFDDKGNPVPELVKEMPTVDNGGVSGDGKVITIKLRDDVVWSDGTPLTADDFVFTYQMVMAPKNAVTSRYPYQDYVASVEAKDKSTVVITLKQYFAAWMTSLFCGTTTVLPKHVLQPVFDKDGTIDNAEWNRKPTVGLGPFVFQEWESASHILFVANPKWYKPPKLQQIFIRIVPDNAAQEAALLAGDSDIGTFLDVSEIDKVEAGGKVKVFANPSGYDEAWLLNVDPKTAHPAMLDVNVRKAIALATDRFTIVKNLLKESVDPVNATFWDMTPPYGDPNIKPYPYDPDQAKQLLDAAGWTVGKDGIREKVINGKTVKLKLRYITTTRELRKNVQAVVQQQWAKVGIAADLVNYDSSIFFNNYKDGGPQALGKYDIAEFSNAAGGFPDPDASDNWLCSTIPSDQKPDGVNYQGYCNPKMDELLKQQATTPDHDARIKLYSQIEQLMYDDVIYIGLWKDPDFYAVSSRLQNVRFAGAAPFWNAHEWTVTP